MIKRQTAHDGTKKTLSEYPEAYVSLKSSTSAIHNDYESVPATLADQSSISQRGLMLTHNLILNVPGDTNLHAGDMINFELPYQKPVEEGEKQELNPYWAGRYLIISLKHIIDQTSQEHMMAIRCVKDSTLNRLPDQTESHLINHRTKTKHQVWSINKMDEEAPANSVAGGGVDLNPTGARMSPSMQRRKKKQGEVDYE